MTKTIKRMCAICGREIEVELLEEVDSGWSYSGGNYFGRIGETNEEYWECDKCFEEVKIKEEVIEDYKKNDFDIVNDKDEVMNYFSEKYPKEKMRFIFGILWNRFGNDSEYSNNYRFFWKYVHFNGYGNESGMNGTACE